MEKTGKNKSFFNFMLAFGFVLVLTGIFLLVKRSEHATRVFAFRPVILLFAGAAVLFVAFAFTKNFNVIFLGILSMLMGVVFLIIDTHIVPFSFRELWPTIVIGSGVSLFLSFLYKYRRISSVFLFPSIMMLVLGTVFLMFSMHVFPFTFRHFITKWWPLLIIIGGASLIGIFLFQQSGNENFPYMEDDSLVQGDN